MTNRFNALLPLLGFCFLGLVACGGDSDGSAELGDDCTGNGDCASGLCANLGSNGQYCSDECNADTPCEPGFACTPTTGDSFICIQQSGPRGVGDASAAGGAGGQGGVGGAGGVGGGAGGAGGGAGGEGGGAGGEGGAGGAPAEDLNCVEVSQCAAACGQDQACGQACIASGSDEARAQVNAILACGQANSCQDQACLEMNCAAEAAACQGGAPPGGGTCADINQCAQGCAPNDQACGQACFNEGNAEAQAQYNAIGMCAQANSCAGNDQACLQENCQPQIETCIGAPIGSGEASCNDVFTCITMCRDQPCVQACYNTGDAQAQQLYGPVNECVARAMCNTVPACEEACGDQLDACRADM